MERCGVVPGPVLAKGMGAGAARACNNIGYRSHAGVRLGHHDQRRAVYHAVRGKITCTVPCIAHETRLDGYRPHRGKKQRHAIRTRAHDFIGGDSAGGARCVFHHNGLPKHGLKFSSDQPRDDISRRPRTKACDDHNGRLRPYRDGKQHTR